MVQEKSASTPWSRIREQKREILNVRRQRAVRRRGTERLVHNVGGMLARPAFFLSLLFVHLAWIVVNSVSVGVPHWDPYPFFLLATVASAEAPFLSLMILMRQQDDRRLADLREEIELQVSLYTEREATTLLHLLRELQQQLQVHSDVDVSGLEEPLDPKQLFEEQARELGETD